MSNTVTPARRKLPLEVRRSRIHGRGALATRRIQRYTRVIEYVGERISPAEANARYDDDAMDHHHTFLFEVDEDTIIDGGRQGNEARFINHSCDPNCAAYVQDGRVFIEAVKNIQPGVELSYDYGLSREGLHRPEWTRLYPCRCGAANCRGTMLKPNRRPRSRRTPRA